MILNNFLGFINFNYIFSKYFFFDIDKYYKLDSEKNIINKWEKLINLIIWKNNINTSLEIIKWNNMLVRQLVYKFNYDKVIKNINNKKNYFYWKKNNILIDKIKYFKIIVINLECFYDYNTNKIYNLYYLNNIIKYCKYNKLKIFLIGELHPKIIISYLFNIKENYISPYNYNSNMETNKLIKIPIQLNVNKIINDIIIKIKSNKNNLCYIGNNLTDYKSFKLIFN